MEEFKVLDEKNFYMGTDLEGIHNYHNYYKDSFTKDFMDFNKKFYENFKFSFKKEETSRIH